MNTISPVKLPAALSRTTSPKQHNTVHFSASAPQPKASSKGRLAKWLAIPMLSLSLIVGCQSKELKDIKGQYAAASVEGRKDLLQKGSSSQENDVRAWMVDQVANFPGTDDEKLALLEPRTRDTDAGIRDKAMQVIVQNLKLPAEKKLPYIEQGLNNGSNWAPDALLNSGLPSEKKLPYIQKGLDEGKSWAVNGLVTLNIPNEQKIGLIQDGLNKDRNWAVSALKTINLPAESKLAFVNQGIQSGKQWAVDLLSTLDVSPDQKFAGLESAFNAATQGKASFDRADLFDKAINLKTKSNLTKLPLLMAGVKDNDSKIQNQAIGIVKDLKDDEVNVPYEFRIHLRTVYSQRPQSEVQKVAIKLRNKKQGDVELNSPEDRKGLQPGFIRVRRSFDRPAGPDFQNAIDALVRMSKSR